MPSNTPLSSPKLQMNKQDTIKISQTIFSSQQTNITQSTQQMEQNLPIVAKKIWKMVRIVYFMLRKGIAKHKLLADLSMLMKRGKIAGKAAIQHLMFHHHGAAGRRSHHQRGLSFTAMPDEYEFSCSDSPAFPIFHLIKRRHSPPVIDGSVMAEALEIFHSAVASPSPSPSLPGFGPSPAVRQLRITDSPFPIRDDEGDSHVDEAAEEFIMRFYRDLEMQNSVV